MIFKFARTGTWWNTIVPQVLGWIYFCLCLRPRTAFDNINGAGLAWNYRQFPGEVILFFLALISISAFGYLFNDLCDIETDELAGKHNFLARMPLSYRFILPGFTLLSGIISWACLLINSDLDSHLRCSALVLFTMQIIALVIYSMNPFRLKNRAEWGALCDAFYGHLNPVLLTFCIFYTGAGPLGWKYIFFLLLIVLCLLKGLRNILLHQLEDRKKDRLADMHTAVLKYGHLNSLNFINRYLLRIEFLLLMATVIVISYRLPPLFISLLLFSIFYYLKFSGWKLADLPHRQLKFKFLYFLNDYYEGWMPVSFLLILAARNTEFVFLLILHLVFFPTFLLKLWNGMKIIGENFKTEDNY